MDKVIELLEGCQAILDDELETQRNTKLFVVKNTIDDCIDDLSDLWEKENPAEAG